MKIESNIKLEIWDNFLHSNEPNTKEEEEEEEKKKKKKPRRTGWL